MTFSDDDRYSKPSTINQGGGVFSDNDLKRLKKAGAAFDLTYDGFLALIARLEAAEKCAEYVFAENGDVNGHLYFEAWRKASGK